MKKIDVAAIRHPLSNSDTLVPAEKTTCIIVTSAEYAENLRIAQERYLKQFFESVRTSLIYS